MSMLSLILDLILFYFLQGRAGVGKMRKVTKKRIK